MTAEERAQAVGHLRQAVFHLASCWDALRDAEVLVEAERGDDVEINEEDISGIASDIGDDPSEAFQLAPETFDAILAVPAERGKWPGDRDRDHDPLED